MGAIDGDVIDGATLDYGDIRVEHELVVQEDSGVIVQVLQCIGQSGTGDGSLPTSGVVDTYFRVDMALGIGHPATPQTEQLEQGHDRYLQRHKATESAEGGGGGGGGGDCKGGGRVRGGGRGRGGGACLGVAGVGGVGGGGGLHEEWRSRWNRREEEEHVHVGGGGGGGLEKEEEGTVLFS